MQTDELSTPLSDSFSKLTPYIGLGERSTLPGPLPLKEVDPLGASAVPSVTLDTISSGQLGKKTPVFEKPPKQNIYSVIKHNPENFQEQ
jgi:hypothetical protein